MISKCNIICALVIATCVAGMTGLWSCSGPSGCSAILSDIERFINERPDSALTVLQQIDPTSLSGSEARARYALLLSKALDKNYIDLTNDSLINIAVNHYARTKDYDRKFQSYYYLGRVYSNAGEYTESMLAYTKAENMVDKVTDPFSAGLLYAQLGYLYRIFYDYPRSLEAYSKSKEYYLKAGDEAHSIFSLVSVGEICLNMKMNDDAEKYLKEGMQWAYSHQYFWLCQSCLESLMTLYEENGQFHKIEDLCSTDYYSVCSQDMTISESLSYKYAIEGRRELAEYHLKEAWDYAKTQKDTIQMYFYEYRIQKVMGNYSEALRNHEEVLYAQDTIVRRTLQQPLLAAQKDYFQTESAYARLKLRHTRIFIILGISIIVLVIVLTSVFISKTLKLKEVTISNYIERVHDLEESLFSERSGTDKLESQLKDMKAQISQLFSRQFALLNKICMTYYENPRKKDSAIVEQVEDIIRKFSTDRTYIRQLEDIVDKYHNNVMSIARESLPFLREMEVRLLCYFFAGFSAKAISVFTGDSVNNIYVKKNRIKEKISRSDSPNKDIILSALS